MIEFILAALPIFLFTLIPGVLLAFPLLKNSHLSLFEKTIFGFILGLVVPPFLMFLASFAGLNYSLPLVLAVSAIVSLVGLVWGMKENAFEEIANFKFDPTLPADKKKLIIWGILSLIMIWSFWARIQSLSPTFYEFDPYYYMYGTQYLLTQGAIPMHDMTAWYPDGSTHRNFPLTNYLTAQWYSIYTQGGAYDNYVLSTVANVYPPLVGALLCFLVFIFIREEYGVTFGMMAALMFAVLPNFIEKFAAGEAEIQPWGVFSLFFFAAAIALLISRKDKRLAVFAGIAAMSVMVGSQYFLIISLVYGGYLGLQSLLEFLRGKDLREFLELHAIVVASIIVTALALSMYVPGYPLTVRIAIVLLPYLFAAVLYAITKYVKGAENKTYAVISIFVLGLAVLLFTPLGTMVQTYVTSAAGFAGYSDPLYMTVAEEAPTAGQLANAFDLLGYSIAGVPLVYLVLSLSLAGLAYGMYKDSKLSAFLLLLIYPVSYVGASKSKYMLQMGFMLVLALAIIFGELDKFAKTFKDETKKASWKRYIKYAAIAFTFLVLLEPGIGTTTPIQANGAFVQLTLANLDSKYWSNGTANCTAMQNSGLDVAAYLHCSKIPNYWLEPMSWIRANVENTTRVTSWWDYGHWINYFGQSNALIRNDNANPTLDRAVADKFVFGSLDNNHSGVSDLASFMQERKSKYVLFDTDLVNKWGALNFLACVYNNETNMSYALANGLTTSKCEQEHRPEYVYIPLASNRTLSDYCASSGTPMVRAISSFGYSYCAYEDSSQNGYPSVLVYENNQTKYNKAILAYPELVSFSGKYYAMYTALYFNNTAVWNDNVSGWDDRKGKFYDSAFYQGFFMGKLDGFEQVYPVTNSTAPIQIYQVRMYKLSNYTE